MSGFVELCTTTNFSFLRAASHPEEYVEQAKALGHAGVGIADRNSLAGMPRAHAKAKEKGFKLAVGVRLVFRDGTPDILVYPKDRAAYGRLTRLLTIGNRRAEKGDCLLDLGDFLEYSEGQRAIIIPQLGIGDLPDETLRRTIEAVRNKCRLVWLAVRFIFDGDDRRRMRVLKELAFETGARLIATTEPHCHIPQRRALLDVMTCIREKITLDEAGRLLAANAERHLKPIEEMQRLYEMIPGAVAETVRFASKLGFNLSEIKPHYPAETIEGYETAQAALEDMTWKGADWRYPGGIPSKIKEVLETELDIVKQLDYAPYFLTVADIVRYARHERKILCQGRGSAANSSICYCLGITSVDPNVRELVFGRFISTERNEPPDIDVDFEHDRREEVIQYVYKKYTDKHAALTSTLICYRKRSALRDVAKAFGYSEDRIATISKTLHWWSKEIRKDDLKALGIDLDDKKLAKCLALVMQLQNFPRHLSQHVGGMVITRERLDEIVPIQNAAMDDRIVIEWNKDDLEIIGILKVDMLALGMLTCLQKAFDMVDNFYPDWVGKQSADKLNLDTLPPEDDTVYAMLQRADSIGVFQVESRAQMSMLPRLQPKEFYDLVIEVAIVRPGPIQGGMVHPYLKRRQGIEDVNYPSPKLEAVLHRTLGIPLFQEQAMQIAIVGAGFSPSRADKLRRAMATFRRNGTIGELEEEFIQGMIDNKYEESFAKQCFEQIKGFGDYGFPESHAASFALLVYASSWLKCHYPDVFAAALLNSQPMGFYAPSEIVRDAIEHGVESRPPDINHSLWDNTLEPGPTAAKHLHSRHQSMVGDIKSTHALRLGFRQIKGLNDKEIESFVANRGTGYDSVRDVWLRGGLEPSTIERLADADCFRSLGLDRRDALWAARGLNRVGGQENLPLFEVHKVQKLEPDFKLPSMVIGEHVVEDYRTLGLSLKSHPAALLREEFTARGAIPADELANMKNGQKVRVAGLVLVRQRPGTASGVIFMTLQDETHVANIVVWARTFERFRPEVLGARLCAVDGVVQKEGEVIHVVAERLHDYSPLLARLSGTEFDMSVTNADEVRRPVEADSRSHPRNVRHNLSYKPAAGVMPKGRNFH
jgi:error-prone DNA polymerase